MKTLIKDPLNLTITGVGGQGNVVISQLIGSAVVEKGYFVVVGETYGVAQRGGAVMSHMRISEKTRYSPIPPHGCADIILGMEPMETLRTLVQFGKPDVITIVNPKPMYPIDVLRGEVEYPDIGKLIETIKGLSAKTWVINAVEEAQKLANPRVANVILIGALIGTGAVPLDKKSLVPVLQERFPRAIEINMIALDKGIELTRQ
jgi:indolepyruvate ferredoxin oxidoreductase beta subunit